LSVIAQQLACGEIVIEVGLLGKKTNLRFHSQITEFQAEDFRAPAGREHQAHEHLQCSSLARTIWAKEAENLTLFDDEVQRMQRPFRPLPPEADLINLLQPQDFDRVHEEIISSDGMIGIVVMVTEVPSVSIQRRRRIGLRYEGKSETPKPDTLNGRVARASCNGGHGRTSWPGICTHRIVVRSAK